MAATTRFAAALTAFSVISGVSASYPSPSVYPSCRPTTTTLTQTVTVAPGQATHTKPAQQYSPPASVAWPGVAFPTYSPEDPNPNGPYYNPHDYIPEPITWPGKPTKGQTEAPPMPTGDYDGSPVPWGGHNKESYGETHWCKKGTNLKPALPQKDTNGDSKWGLIDCPRLPPYLPGDGSFTPTSSGHSVGPRPTKSAVTSSWHSMSSGFSHPGNATKSASSTKTASSHSSMSSGFSDKCIADDLDKACQKMPETGVTRKYKFDVTYETIKPDGVTRNTILVNKQYPGPLIEANWGDWIEVEVTNSLPYDAGSQGEPIALHWHGLLQQETPWYDGVPSVQQCPIAPEKTVTYKFRADHYGTTWYHSHYSAQYAGGAYGPIVIHGPATECYDEDIGPVVLSDWYHKDYFSQLQGVMTGTIPLSNNALINGKMNFPCQNTTFECTPNAGVSKFAFKSGKKYRLRLINTSAEATMKYTIDGHEFTVISNDFTPIESYKTKVITLAVGQRTDVVVEAVGKAGESFWMRSEMGNAPARNGCSFVQGASTQAVAAVYYEGADTDSLPETTSELTQADKTNCQGDALSTTVPLCPIPLEEDFELVELDFTFASNGTNFVWSVNNQTFRAHMNSAIMEQVAGGNKDFKPEWNVFEFSHKKAIRFHMRNHFQIAHPMHLHGHDFNVLAAGVGVWDGTIVNPEKTQVRDTQTMLGLNPATNTPSYLVIQFNQDNPGVWPMHCHIAWHVSQGLYINVLERPDEFAKFEIPAGIKETCDGYNAWNERNVVHQIDSGL